MNNIKTALLTTAAFVSVLATDPAWSQENSAPSEQNQLGDIVVTANRREERLQDVPISISAFATDTLKKANVEGAFDLVKVVPSLKIATGSATALPFLRGVGNAAVGVGNEASVAIYVDGVYFSRLPPAFFEFNSIERVEVLKGPQGTLFGRNSTGGLIQIITKDPSHDTLVEANVGYSNYDTIQANAYATTGFGDSLAGDIAVRYVNQGKGWGHNLDTGDEAYYHRDFAARSKWLFTPSDSTKITVAGDYLKTTFNSLGIDASFFPGTTVREQLPPHNFVPNGGFYDTHGTPAAGYAKTWGIMGKLEQDIGFANFVSISAYRDMKGDANFEVDGTLTDFFYATGEPYHIEQFTQEVQLLSKPDSPIDWIVGGYYMYNKSAYVPTTLGGIAIGGVPEAKAYLFADQVINSYSAFGQTTIHLGDKTDLTLGGRYTKDELKAKGRTDFEIPGVIFVPGTTQNSSVKFNKFTWKVALDHKFTDDFMVFASVSRGYKGGIFNILPFQPNPAKPEVIDAYEAGFKTSLFDRRVRLNASVFRYDIKDPQVNIYPPEGTGILLINADKARITGVDLDGQIAVTQGLRVNFALTYLDAKYRDFTDAPFYLPSPYPVAGFPPSIPDPVSGNANGNRMPQAPKWAGNIGFSYETPISLGKLQLSANYYRTSKYYFHPDNLLVQKGYGLLDAQIGIGAEDDRWTAQIWGKNLAKEKYIVGASEIGQYYGFRSQPAPPRTYGVTLGFKFQ